MGLVDPKLLERLADAEFKEDWDMTLEILAMIQLNAMKEYARQVRELTDESKEK